MRVGKERRSRPSPPEEARIPPHDVCMAQQRFGADARLPAVFESARFLPFRPLSFRWCSGSAAGSSAERDGAPSGHGQSERKWLLFLESRHGAMYKLRQDAGGVSLKKSLGRVANGQWPLGCGEKHAVQEPYWPHPTGHSPTLCVKSMCRSLPTLPSAQ